MTNTKTPQATGGELRELPPAQIEQGWRDTFSTENPFCPCDLKSFTKAVRWALRQNPAIAPGGDAMPEGVSDNADYIEFCAGWMEKHGRRIAGSALRLIASEYRTLAALPAADNAVDAWTGEVESCDAKGMWLVMADDCPLVPGQKVTITAALTHAAPQDGECKTCDGTKWLAFEGYGATHHKPCPDCKADPPAVGDAICEGGAPECGPVEFWDSEGVPLCRVCWEGLLADSAQEAAK